jgi:hypothetical protein
VSAGTRALRTVDVLPDELALRQSVDRPLQAVREESGGMRAQVLQQADDSVLRDRRLLSEEPLVLLRRLGPPDMLPATREVRHPNPSRQRWRRSPHSCDLLSTRAVRPEGEDLLSRRTGRIDGPRDQGQPRAQPLLLPGRPDLWLGSGDDLLPVQSETCCSGKCVDLRFNPQNCGSCGNVCASGVCREGICALP